MDLTDNIQKLIDDLRSEGLEVFAERLEALGARQQDAFRRYSENQRQMIDVLKQGTPLILDATVGMRRGV